MKCRICKVWLDESSAYEYRGDFACDEHFDKMVEWRDFERNQMIREEGSKTKHFKGLDLSDSVIGKENRKLLKGKLEVASMESLKLYNYERGRVK